MIDAALTLQRHSEDAAFQFITSPIRGLLTANAFFVDGCRMSARSFSSRKAASPRSVFCCTETPALISQSLASCASLPFLRAFLSVILEELKFYILFQYY